MEKLCTYRKLIGVLLLICIPTGVSHQLECIGNAQSRNATCNVVNYNSQSLKTLKIPKPYQHININNLIFISSIVKELSVLKIILMEEFRRLELIDLRHSSVSYLTQYDFSIFYKLSVLKLAYNYLKELNEMVFFGAKNLITIDLEYNQINFIHRHAFKRLPKLANLDLSHNQLKVLSDDRFAKLDLKCLNLDFNQIAQFSVSDLTKIEELLLNNNELVFLKINAHVKALSADNNYLQLEHLILNSSTVISLSLRNNSIMDLYFFKNMSNLTVLDISHNPIQNERGLGEVLSKLKNLQTLILESTNLNQFDIVIFSELRNLETFDISSNNLSSIDFNVLSRLENLQYLNLSYNNLNIETFNKLDDLFRKLNTIDIRENNWTCTDLYEIMTKLQHSNTVIPLNNTKLTMSETNIAGIRCSNTSLIETKLENDTGSSNIFFFIVIILIVILSVFAIVIVIYCKCRSYRPLHCIRINEQIKQ